MNRPASVGFSSLKLFFLLWQALLREGFFNLESIPFPWQLSFKKRSVLLAACPIGQKTFGLFFILTQS
jgi:hypothetical protein